MPPRRILILGTSGSGKTTVARRVAAELGIPHVELDAIRHQANWIELPDDQFRDRVARAAGDDSWVIDGNYGVVKDLTRPRATMIVWLDLPRWRVMSQVIWRSLSRAITRRELWNGNRERFSTWLQADHPIRWAWNTHARRRRDYGNEIDERWVRLCSRREIDAWVKSLAADV
jgi:adenylate kinase family enzyme